MIRSGKKSKENSPAPSRTSSLRGASASEAHHTILHLQNDDWSDEELGLGDSQGRMAQNGENLTGPNVERLDLAAVAQLMKSTVRKRSPKVRSNHSALAPPSHASFKFKNRPSLDQKHQFVPESLMSPVVHLLTILIQGVFGIFSFSRNKKEKSSRSGSENGLHGIFTPNSRNEPNSELANSLASSTSTLSPSSSSNNISIGKGSPFRRKKHSTSKTSSNTAQLAVPEEKVSDSKRKAYRRANSMADVKPMANLETDLNSILLAHGAGSTGALQARGGSLRTGLTKKELKEIEKKEKKALKEARKEVKRQNKLLAKKEKGNSKSRSSSSNSTRQEDLVSHRYTAEMTSLPSQFDPAALKSALTPLAISQRVGSPSRLRPAASANSTSQSAEILKVNLATGQILSGDAGASSMGRSISEGGLAPEGVPDNFSGINDALIRALSSEQLSQDPTTKEKRQSFMNLQMLASDLSDLNFDFNSGELSLSGLPTSDAPLARSSSVSGQRDFSDGASSLYSDPSSLLGEDDDDDDSSSSFSSSDSESDGDASDGERDDASVASSNLSTSWAFSLSTSTLEENDVDLNKKALENGTQVELVRKIGRGGTGLVWFGLLDGRPVAVKQIELREVSKKRLIEVRNAIKREVELMRSLNCPQIIRYFGIFASKAQQQITLIMELVAGLSVTALILEHAKLSEPLAAFIIHQVLLGLQFLRENMIVHRDLKPDNLLINARGKIKMIDFGTAAKLEANLCRRSTVGTPWYCAPEVIRSEDYSYPADIWSLGCTLIELLSGKPPYDDLQDVACLFKMAEGHMPPLPPGISPNCELFLKSCLAPSPADRLDPTQLLNHPWLVNALNDKESVSEELCRVIEVLLSSDDSASKSSK